MGFSKPKDSKKADNTCWHHEIALAIYYTAIAEIDRYIKKILGGFPLSINWSRPIRQLQSHLLWPCTSNSHSPRWHWWPSFSRRIYGLDSTWPPRIECAGCQSPWHASPQSWRAVYRHPLTYAIRSRTSLPCRWSCRPKCTCTRAACTQRWPVGCRWKEWFDVKNLPIQWTGEKFRYSMQLNGYFLLIRSQHVGVLSYECREKWPLVFTFESAVIQQVCKIQKIPLSFCYGA